MEEPVTDGTAEDNERVDEALIEVEIVPLPLAGAAIATDAATRQVKRGALNMAVCRRRLFRA